MIQAITNTSEVTGSQTISYLRSYDGELNRDTVKVGTIKDLRALRKDATIALGRGLLVSGILAGAWSVESEEEVKEEVTDFITLVMLPLRESIMQACVAFGRVDFGFMPFEKIFALKDGRYVIDRLKPLLHDMTTILVDPNGNFNGFRQRSPGQALGVDVPLEKCLLINFEVEGGNLYGYPLLENIRAAQTMWTDCNTGAKKYDQKIAGSHFVVHYPPGTSEVDGETVDNAEIAKQLLAALESSGSMAMPSTTAEEVQELNDQAVSKLYQWDVTLLSDLSARQPSFIDRLRYLDSLKIRGLILPERSCLEGQMGTLAEAQTHVGLAITNMQEIDKSITHAVNISCVDQLLLLNFGEELVGKVRLVASPLVDTSVAFLRKLYLALGGKRVDIVALQEKLNIPLGEEKEIEPNVKPNVESED